MKRMLFTKRFYFIQKGYNFEKNGKFIVKYNMNFIKKFLIILKIIRL